MPGRRKNRHRTDRHRLAGVQQSSGANDGIFPHRVWFLGVAAAHATHGSIWSPELPACGRGDVHGCWRVRFRLLAGPDTERAELDLERAELKSDDKGEHKELAAIYVARGLDPALAKKVAEELMAHDAVGALMPANELGHQRKLFERVRFKLHWHRLRALLSERASDPCHGHVTGGGFDSACFSNFTRIPCASRWVGGTRRRSRRDGGCNPCHFLGCAGHVRDAGVGWLFGTVV